MAKPARNLGVAPHCLQTNLSQVYRLPPRGLLPFALRSIALLSVALLGVACDQGAKCERERLEVFKAWDEVHKAAYERKLAGVDQEQWKVIESKADLLQSAFATKQITWDSADKAQDAIAKLAPTLKTDSEVKLEVFRNSAARASGAQRDFAATCR